MAMYYYASKISAIACGTRCRQTVLQKSRGQRDRDKYATAGDDADDEEDEERAQKQRPLVLGTSFEASSGSASGGATAAAGAAGADGGILYATPSGLDALLVAGELASGTGDGVRYRRRHSEQLDAYDIELGFQKLEVSTAKSTKSTFTGYGIGNANMDSDIVQYDIPKNSYKRTRSDVNYESSVLGSGGIMYINGRIVSGPLESLIEVLVPKNLIDFDKEFIFSFLLSSRLFLRPHELLGKLLSSVPDSESLESLVALLAEWTNKFPYDYRDERMMSHVKHIVARCSNTNLEGVVSEILSALLNRLTDLERHEEDLRACQTTGDKPEDNTLDCPTASHYAQILCRLEKKLAKQIGPEEFLQCSSNVLLDKQKKWDQPTTSGGPPGAQDPKKTCNLETYLDWSARLRLFVCNEILQCTGIRDRSKTVELWSGVAQYCLLVGNYNSATAILETLESPPIARLKITWSKLQVTCQQLDCMQRHAEGHGDLWHKQAIILNENHQKTDTSAVLFLSASSSSAAAAATATTLTAATTATTSAPGTATTTQDETGGGVVGSGALSANVRIESTADGSGSGTVSASGSGSGSGTASTVTSGLSAIDDVAATATAAATILTPTTTAATDVKANGTTACSRKISSTAATKPKTATTTTTTATKPNDWVVIPVFADIVKLALAGRDECLQRLPNGHINIIAFDRMAAIVGAFTKHMHAVKSATEAPPGEYETFCQHMQRTSKLAETELMMASFDCEEPNNAEKLMYDLN